MANALPLLVLAGAAAVLMSRKKKKKSSTSGGYESFVVPPTSPPPAATKTSGPSDKTASAEIWKQRQTALAFVAGMKVCNCHPGNIDGFYGPATVNAIIAFQVCTDIGVDGKWGPQTDAMMKRILAQIAEGQVYIKKASKTSGAKTSGAKTSSGGQEVTPEDWSAKNILGYMPGNVAKVDTFSSDRAKAFWLDVGDRFVELAIPVNAKLWGGRTIGDYSLSYWNDVVTTLRTIAIDHPDITFSFVLDNNPPGGVGLFLWEQKKVSSPEIVKKYALHFEPEEMLAKLPKAIDGWLFSVGGWLKGMNQTL